MSQYRDGLAGLVAQVATKRAAARDRQARLAPALRGMLPSKLAAEIDALEATLATALATDRADFTTLTAADSALDALLAAYERGLELAPPLGRCATDLPDVAVPTTPAPWLLEERRALQFRAAMTNEVQRAFDEVEIVRWGDFGYVARATGAEIPFLLVARVTPTGDAISAPWPRYALALQTTMPSRLPSLHVQRKQVLLALGAALGMAERILFDDPKLDEQLWARGSKATATLLGESAKSALVTLSPHGVVLDVSRGLASVEWSGELDPWAPQLFIEAARDVLVEMRRELAKQCALVLG